MFAFMANDIHAHINPGKTQKPCTQLSQIPQVTIARYGKNAIMRVAPQKTRSKIKS